MNILAFAEVCKYATVRSYIISLSKGFSNNPEIQDDLYYTAWMAIIEQEGDYTVEWYCEVASKAMIRKYVRCYIKEYKYLSWDKGIRKTKKKLKFYKKLSNNA